MSKHNQFENTFQATHLVTIGIGEEDFVHAMIKWQKLTKFNKKRQKKLYTPYNRSLAPRRLIISTHVGRPALKGGRR